MHRTLTNLQHTHRKGVSEKNTRDSLQSKFQGSYHKTITYNNAQKNLRNLSVQKHTPTNIEGTQVDTIFFDSVPKIDVETRFRKEVMNGWC